MFVSSHGDTSNEQQELNADIWTAYDGASQRHISTRLHIIASQIMEYVLAGIPHHECESDVAKDLAALERMQESFEDVNAAILGISRARHPQN